MTDDPRQTPRDHWGKPRYHTVLECVAGTSPKPSRPTEEIHTGRLATAVRPELVTNFDQRGGFLKPAEG